MTDEEWKKYLLEYKKAKLKRVPLDMPIQKYQELKEAADKANEPVNSYIKKAIQMRIESERHSRDWIPISRQMPPDMEAITVTLEDGAGNRYIQDMVRFNRKMEDYTNKFKSEHPNGVWEWPYELGADYWEDVRGTVIAWIPDPEPYLGD